VTGKHALTACRARRVEAHGHELAAVEVGPSAGRVEPFGNLGDADVGPFHAA